MVDLTFQVAGFDANIGFVVAAGNDDFVTSG